MSSQDHTTSRASGQQDWIKRLGKKAAEVAGQVQQSSSQQPQGPPPGYPTGPSAPYGGAYPSPNGQQYPNAYPYPNGAPQQQYPYGNGVPPQQSYPSAPPTGSTGHSGGGSMQDKLLQKLNDPAVQAKAKKILLKQFMKEL